MAKYKDEGIGKLLDIYNNDLKGLIDRLDALKKAAEDFLLPTHSKDPLGQKCPRGSLYL